MTTQVFLGTKPVQINRGVKQGDTISFKIFTAEKYWEYLE